MILQQNIHIGIRNGAAMEKAIWKGQSTGVWKNKKPVTRQRCVDSYLQRQ